MKNNSTFFERLKDFSKSEGYKSINDFAINGLKYKSSQRLNRLRDGKKKPSLEIIEDIKSRFETIDLNWLIANKGEKYLPGAGWLLEDSGKPYRELPEEELCRQCELRDQIIASQKQTIQALQGQAEALQLSLKSSAQKSNKKNS